MKHGLRFLLPVLAAAGLALALAGCGDLSLLDTLREESPGQLRFSPSAALVPEGKEFTFSVLGGFTPYAVAASGELTPKEENTWVFPGTEIDGESKLFTIEATDWLGNKATAEVTVYAAGSPLQLSPAEVTLLVGQEWTFTASGGSGGYLWSVDGVPEASPVAPEQEFTYTAQEAGLHSIEVNDSVGLSQAATVTVKAAEANAPLEITPLSVVVATGGTTTFMALGGSGDYAFSALLGTFADAGDNPAAYTAPADSGSDTVTLSDGASSVQATVLVVDPLLPQLSLYPVNPTVSAIGDLIQFYALNGEPPYTFSSGKPDQGSIDAATGLYKQLGVKNVVVTVTDSTGVTANTTVKYKKE